MYRPSIIVALLAVVGALLGSVANADAATTDGAYRPGAVSADGVYRGGSLQPNPRVHWGVRKPMPRINSKLRSH